MKEKEVEMEEKKNSHSSFIWSAVPSGSLELFSVINCSDGAAAPKGSMTFGTTQMRSESCVTATESKRPAKRFESQGGQMNSQEAS